MRLDMKPAPLLALLALITLLVSGCVSDTPTGVNAAPGSGEPPEVIGTTGPIPPPPPPPPVPDTQGDDGDHTDDQDHDSGSEEDGGSVKFHPGHYIAMNDWDNQAAMIGAVRPGVRGIHKRYMWKDLEPAFGQYDFSQIASDLDLMADHGMQLVVMIEDKRFSDIVPTPAYLWDEHTLRHGGGGYIAKRWSPWVVERMGALTQAMGERFDGHPNLEGIAFQESATSMTMASLNANGYTPEKYRDALIQMLASAKAHFPRSRVFWYMNFIEGNNGYLAHVAEAVAPHGITMGGPDVLPDNASLNRHAYPLYRLFKDRMTLFGSMQYVAYNHVHLDKSRPTKYWTMQELFEFARDELHVNYVFWTRKPFRDPADSYLWTDALPVIRDNPHFN